MKDFNVVCFHNPNEENGYLSNWYLSDFTVNGIKYSSMEQYMMFQKALMFNDAYTTEKILATDDVAKIKAYGRGVTGYNDHIWNGIRQIVVYDGLKAKFEQNEELKKMLLETGDSFLAECAVNDRIWGIGLSMTNPDRLNIYKWNGKNLLGYSLMIVRKHLYGMR